MAYSNPGNFIAFSLFSALLLSQWQRVASVLSWQTWVDLAAWWGGCSTVRCWGWTYCLGWLASILLSLTPSPGSCISKQPQGTLILLPTS